MFIAIEGGEGVGKTTQMRMLKERLPRLVTDRNFVFTREPGGTPFADKIREVILSEEAKGADGKTMFGLFAAARAEHLARIILPALAGGNTVVTDRFVAATYAYQAYAQQNPISEEFFEKYYDSLDVLPDVTIVLDMDPVVAQERVKARAEQAANHFDVRPIEFHLKLREGYASFAEKFSTAKHRVVMVDASHTPNEVHLSLVGVVLSSVT